MLLGRYEMKPKSNGFVVMMTLRLSFLQCPLLYGTHPISRPLAYRSACRYATPIIFSRAFCNRNQQTNKTEERTKKKFKYQWLWISSHFLGRIRFVLYGSCLWLTVVRLTLFCVHYYYLSLPFDLMRAIKSTRTI